jgi:acetolactate synthase I/II/III large subunit
MTDRLVADSVADSVAEALAAAGIKHMFLLTGGDQALWIALREAGVQLVLARSEQGAVYMADGYARASGSAAVTYGQNGPGAANVAAALCDAWWGGSPVVALTSSVPHAARDKFPYQFIDQLTMFSLMTKWQADAADPSQAAILVEAATRIATRIPMGPVHVDLPRDVIRQSQPASSVDASSGETQRDVDPSAIKDFAAELAAAHKPVVVAGSGVVRSGCWTELRAAVDRLQIPVATTPGGKGAFPEDHQLSIGVMGRYSRRIANELVAQADVVLAVGTRLGSLSTVDGEIPNQSARILHIDVDPSVFSVTYPRTSGLEADAGTALARLARLGQASARHDSWRAEVSRAIARWRDQVSDLVTAHRGDGLHPAQVMASLAAATNPSDMVVADTGYMAAWTAALFPVREAGRRFLRAAGSLGWALPASLGASLATPDGRVVCVTGDGGVGYNLVELETAARLKIPVVVLVLNNRSLAFEYHEQLYQWQGKVVHEANDFSDVNYAAVAAELGARGQRVERADELMPALRQALQSKEPWLLDVLVDKEAVAPVTNFESMLPRVI